jgi:hypothetical protein
MRLSDENARRLNALVWQDRARRWAPLIALIVGAAALLTFFLLWQTEHADPTVDVRTHMATVLDVRHAASRGPAVVRVHLADGRDVEALSGLRVDPAAGAHVIVNEARHASGKLTYDIARLAE